MISAPNIWQHLLLCAHVATIAWMFSRKGASSRAIVAGLLAAAAFVIAVIGVWLYSASRAPRSTGGGFAVTLFPTSTVSATDTPELSPTSPLLSTPLPTIVAPPPTARAAQYTVQLNDTLWDIALRFGFTNPDAIVAANPGLNPDLLPLGQVLNIPGLDFIPPPQPVATTAPVGAPAGAGAQAQVKSDAGGLRLRREPIAADNVMTKLSPLTSLRIIGRTADDIWLQIVTPNGTTGWVMSQYVETVAVSGGDAALTLLPIAATAAPASASAPASRFEYPPYRTDLTPRVAEIFRVGQARGNRANAFALIGDSNTENPKFLRAFDLGQYELGDHYSYLKDTVSFFAGSFNRVSPAARGGFNTTKVLDPNNTSLAECVAGETPVACELRITRPSVALVLIGTGDQHSWQGFEERFRSIVNMTIDAGVIPVLITKGDDLEHRDNSAPSGFINSVIRRVAAEYQVPLLNFSQVLDSLPAHGFIEDGFHYNFPADGRSADFTQDKLVYGFNQRNLTALQALDVLRRSVIAP